MKTVLLLLALLVFAPPAHAQSLRSLPELLAETGLEHTRVGTSLESWRIPFRSVTGTGTFDVYVTYANDDKDFALIFTTVVDGAKGEAFGQPLLARALTLDNDYTGVKFAYDQEYGDLDCQAEVYLGAGAVTPAELELYVNAVARMADSTRAELNALK